MNYTSKINSIIDNLKLPEEIEDNREIIKSRFVEEVSFYEKKRDITKRYYNIFRFIVTIGSIFLPAILSIGQMDPSKLPKHFDQITYWSSWSISLMVTISNGFLQLFSLDKNYFNYSLVVEQLKTEGWQFFGLSGKYEEHDTHNKGAYKDFCKAIEDIKRKQVEQEFQGKGNNTKKKEKKGGDNTTPLLKNNKDTFDFKSEMKSLMEQSINDDTFKPLTKTLEKISDVENVVDKAQNVVKDTAQSTIKDIIKDTENVAKNVVENTGKTVIQSTIKEVDNSVKESTDNKDKKDKKDDESEEENLFS